MDKVCWRSIRRNKAAEPCGERNEEARTKGKAAVHEEKSPGIRPTPDALADDSFSRVQGSSMSSIDREEIEVEGLAPAVSHYTHAVRFGDLLFVSGLVGLDENLKVVSSDVIEQTRKIFDDLRVIMNRVGADFSNVLKVTVYLTDVNDRTRINPLRQEYFGASRPASTLIGISSLVLPELKVEIEAVVGIPGGERPARDRSSAAYLNR
jgi:reactive intermediate/imine deaminase